MADPALVVLGSTVAFAIVSAAVLGALTPQNEWDSLTYHLTRAALWIQQGSVGYVDHVADVRVNGNPPNAEIGQAWTILLARSDRFVFLPAFGAVLASTLGVLGIARRVGLDAREAVLGSLVFACLPLVVLHASTALNDLVVASFFVVATFFAFGTRRASAAAAALALGLAFGTKISAPLLLPVYLIVVLAARRRRVREQLAIATVGVVIGAPWYVLNLAKTDAVDGGMADAADQVAGHSPASIVTRAYELLLNTIELPGASPSLDRGLYVVAGAALAIAAAVAASRGARQRAGMLLGAAGLVVAVPLVVWLERAGVSSGWRAIWSAAGRNEPADELTSAGVSVRSDSAATWYGPIGAIFILAGFVLALRAPRDRRPVLIAMSLAPMFFIGVLAVALIWDPWRGRFLLFPIALAAATWGLAYHRRALTWALVSVAAATTLLVTVNSHTKPLGLRLLASSSAASVFGLPRWQVQVLARDEAGTGAVLRFAETSIPEHANVALSLRQDDYSYPYFGAKLGRTVRFVGPGERAPAASTWIVEAPGRAVATCADSWTTAFTTPGGFRVLRRIGADSC